MRLTLTCPHCGQTGSTSASPAPDASVTCKGCGKSFPAWMGTADEDETFPMQVAEPPVQRLIQAPVVQPIVVAPQAPQIIVHVENSQPQNYGPDGFGVTSIIFGLLALAFSLCPCASWLGGILGLVGFTFGCLGLWISIGGGRGTGFAVGGLTLCFTAIILVMLWIVLAHYGINVLDKIQQEIEKKQSPPPKAIQI